LNWSGMPEDMGSGKSQRRVLPVWKTEAGDFFLLLLFRYS